MGKAIFRTVSGSLSETVPFRTPIHEILMPRMRILSSSEQEAFDKPPQFDHRKRKQFLDLPKVLEDRAATLRTPSNQIGFLVMCGYFRATKRFYLQMSGPRE